jgi:hypothetical protein
MSYIKLILTLKKIYTKFEISCSNYKCKNMKKKTDIDFTAIFIQVDIGGIRKISMFIDFNLLTEHGKALIPHVQFLEALCGKVAEAEVTEDDFGGVEEVEGTAVMAAKEERLCVHIDVCRVVGEIRGVIDDSPEKNFTHLGRYLTIR